MPIQKSVVFLADIFSDCETIKLKVVIIKLRR